MKKKTKKKKYEKPELKTIKLHADEVLVAGCKSFSSSGPESSTCGFPGPTCRGSGS